MKEQKNISKKEHYIYITVLSIIVISLIYLLLDINEKVDKVVRIVYCEDRHEMFVGFDDEEVNDYVIGRYVITENADYIIQHALYCDMNNRTCTPYQGGNDWIVARKICRSFNFKLKGLILQ